MLRAFKNSGISEPVSSIYRKPISKTVDQYKAAFREISNIKIVSTVDGLMMLCNIDYSDDLNNPDIDWIVLIGSADNTDKLISRTVKHKLWFYDNRYWANARSSNGLEYYKNKQFLLYEVSVTQDVIDCGIFDTKDETPKQKDDL